MRIAAGIEYQGSSFQGWQSQAHGQTVQDHLERALSSIACHPVRTHAAGRTDAGVHALAQVVHFDTESVRPLQAWVRGSNALLPGAIAVRWAKTVDEKFHARFSARSRHYRYVLFNHPVRPAILQGFVGWHHRVVDLDAIRDALRFLVGEQDFSSFRSSECQAKSPVKTMHRAGAQRYGDYVVFEFQANGFLHHMVRNIVGAMVHIGCGKESPGWINDLLAARNRTFAPPTFAADGLYFSGVEYDTSWQLPLEGRIITAFHPGAMP